MASISISIDKSFSVSITWAFARDTNVNDMTLYPVPGNFLPLFIAFYVAAAQLAWTANAARSQRIHIPTRTD